MKVIDLRSDTLSLPTGEMLKEIKSAKLGDDGRNKNGKGEDETVVELENLAAKIFRKEDALFVPSGTMGNMISLMTYANRGENIIVGNNNHIYKSEKGNFDYNVCGFIPKVVKHTKGVYDLNHLEETLRKEIVSAVCIENSHNFEGGTVMSKKDIDSIAELCKRYNVPVHLDGARIFNAALYLNEEVSNLTENVDSVMACLSKGLSAPIGSVILGTSEFIKKARIKRKMIGGQLRQVGVIAAPGIIALRNMVNRLEEDNLLAKKLADKLLKIEELNIDMSTVQTNIVKATIVKEGLSSDKFIDDLNNIYKLRIHRISDNEVRFVTYRSITSEDIEEAAERLYEYFGTLKI